MRRRKASKTRTAGASLDARAHEAIARFVRVLARCGGTPQDIAAEVGKACRRIPKSWTQEALESLRERDDASHLLTLWFSNPAYLDAKGSPAPLPLRGANRSIEALAAEVDRTLDRAELLRYLLRTGAVRKVGVRYVPRDRVLLLRGSGGPQHSRILRGLLVMLRTLEHNSQPKSSAPGWYEVFAANPHFPVSALAAFDKRLRRAADRFLQQMDTDMHRRERARVGGEPTVRLGVGIYRFEEEPGFLAKRARRPRQ